MRDTTGQTDAIVRAAGHSLAAQRAGGTHRRQGALGASIGRGSRSLKIQTIKQRAALFGASLLAIMAGITVAGLVLGGVGFAGLVSAFFAVVIAAIVFANFPRVKVPRRADLSQARDARVLVARTELWLEHQRPGLPPPALPLIDDLGAGLDALGSQLQGIDPGHPAAAETRKLVGEYLPETIEAWQRIPPALRREARAGTSPDDQLLASLARIRDEIGQVTRQLAEGSIDELAIRARFLDYRYPGAGGQGIDGQDGAGQAGIGQAGIGQPGAGRADDAARGRGPAAF